MALPTFQSQGTVVAAATTAPAGLPSSFAAGDLLLYVIHTDGSAVSVSTSGWTALGSIQTGGGMATVVYAKVSNGTETGTLSATITGGTKGVAYTVAYRSAGTGGLSAVLYRTGADVDTSSTAYSASGSSWTLAVDDRIVACTIMLAAAAGTFAGIATSPSLTQAGATAAASTSRFAARANTNTTYYNHSDAAVTGAGSGAPSFTATANGANAAGVTAFIAIREVPNNPPTVTAVGGNQNLAAAVTANLSFTAADTDGSVASVATTFDFPTSGAPALTGGTTSTPSFTTGSAPHLYVVRQTATDNVGATGFGTVEVRVPTTGTAAPISGYGANLTGSWSNVGGAASVEAALNDASDSTYLESAALSATEQEARVRVDPVSVRTSGTVTVRVAQDVAGTIVAKARLYEGTTLRQEWTLTTTTSFADQVCTLSGATIAAISDWGNLWVAVAGTA